MFKRKREEGKSLHSSMFFAILCINLCSILVLSVFNFYVFHHISGKAYRESFLSYNQRVTELAFRNIDNQIIQPVIKLSQLYFSPNKENAPVLLPQEKAVVNSSESILALSTEMKKIQKNYPYILGIDIYYEATNTVVTAFDKVHFPQSEEMTAQYLPWYEKYKKRNPVQGELWLWGKVYPMDKPAVLCINEISRYNWNGENIILAAYISPESFGEYIDLTAGQLTLMTKDNQVLYDSGSEDSEQGMTEELIQITRKNTGKVREREHPFPITNEKGEWMVFYAPSSLSGLTYFYRINNSLFYRDYEITNRMFLFNFLISILFNIIVLLIISYYNHIAYRKRVLTLSEEAGIAIHESERSFDGSIGALTKELSSLHKAVYSSRGLLFQGSVRSLILNRKSGEGEEKLEPYLTGSSCCTVLLYLTEQDLEELSVESLQEEYPPDHLGYHVLFTTVDRDALAGILIFDNGHWEETKKQFIKGLDSRWKGYHLVSGQIFPINKDGIRSSYKSTLEIARYRYIFPREKYLSYEQVGVWNRKESGSHLKLFDTIKKDLYNENLLDLKMRIEMLATSFKNGGYTIDYCSSTLRDLITLLYQMMQQYQLDMWVVFGYDIRDYYKKISDIEAFQSWCEDLCEMILKNIHQKKQSVDVDIQERILRLVEEHLENNISLDFLAEQLKVRPDAASRMFRHIMGTSYTEYIKNKKLNRAIELMAEGLSVKEAAERLGYSSAQYFIKVFKESYGITPYQHKKNQEKEKKRDD